MSIFDIYIAACYYYCDDSRHKEVDNMDERLKFETDAKSLNVMIIVQSFLVELVFFVISAILIGMKLDEDFALLFTSLIASCVVTYYIIKHYQKKFALKLSYKTVADFNIYTYLKFAVMALGIRWLTSTVISYITDILSKIIIFETPDFSAKYNLATNIILCIHTIIVAPITEELLFRGIILTKLKRYEKNYAIIIVSILFGILHGNLSQAVPAFMMSLFLCQVTLKSNSMIPAISIHMINNAFAQLSDINNTYFQILLDVIIVVIIIAAIILAIKEYKVKKRHKIEYKIIDYFKNWAGMMILIFSVFSILASIKII